MEYLTDEYAQAWAHLDRKWREMRMKDWALMLEKRVAELDPMYKAYPFGRTVINHNSEKQNELLPLR